MFKSTLTFSNGTVANIECETMQEFQQILSHVSGVARTESKQPIPSVTNATSPVRMTDKQTPGRVITHTRKIGTGYREGWAKDSLLTLARLTLETSNTFGSVPVVVTKMKNAGVEVERGLRSIYVMASRVRRYLFSGSSSYSGGLSNYVISALKSGGYYPGIGKTLVQKSSSSEESGLTSREIMSSYPTRGRRFSRKAWTKKDILGVATIVSQNLHLTRGLGRIVGRWIRKNGDIKLRSNASVDSIVSDLKQYLLNNKSGTLGKRVVNILNEAQIFPASTQRVPVRVMETHSELLPSSMSVEEA